METADSIFPASYAQRRLWFIQQMAPASAAYNMVLSVPLPAGVDAALLQSALDALAARHEGLRTRFASEDGEVVQRIAPHGGLPLHVHRLAERAAFGPILSRAASEPFDLSAAPLARAHLALAGDGPPVLSLVVHHIIADGQTLRILVEDLEGLYQARGAGAAAVLPELPIEYADYAVWQMRSLSGRRLEALADFWKRRLDGLPELELPRDHDRPPTGTVRGGVVPFRLPAEVADGLRALAAGARTTLFAALLGGFSALLARFSGQRAFAVGLPVSGRTRVELERVAGLFINSLVFRAEVEPGTTFAQLVRRTGERLAEDLSHQEMPFELVVDALRVQRRADRNPLFQVMMQLQVQQPQPAGIGEGGADEPPLDAEALSSQLDLSFILFDTGAGAISGAAVYATDLFDRESITELVDAYGVLLAAALRAPHRPVHDLPLLDAGRRDALLALGEGPRRAWEGPETLHAWFAAQARETPERVAVEAEDARWTFAELDARAEWIAAALRRTGARPGEIVAVCMPRSPELVAAVLGVLRAGAAYLVLDPASPRRRLEHILADSRARVVVVPAGRAESAYGRPAVEVDAEGGIRIDGIDVDRDPAESAAPSPSISSAAAYVIYTSGSTGEPKGVAIPHGAIVNHMRWMIGRFGFGAGERVLQRTPLTFDASVWELWAPLLSGGTLVLAPADGPFDPARLLGLIRRKEITVLQAVPSLLRALLDRPEAARCTSLRQVFCGGEALGPELRDRFFATLDAGLCNLYGPTETTIDATFHVFHRGETGEVPIGRAVENAAARVLDGRMQPVPRGVAGELCIGGAAVGLGYVGDPARTAERFVPDPWTPGGRLFRTGDRVRMRADGALLFLGRMDDQVKVRGFRIELGEVESQLARHPAVAEAAAVVQDHGAGDQRLVAFVRLIENAPAGVVAELQGWLRGRLPAHAVPSAIGPVEQMPKTAHGKLDRAALRLASIAREPQAAPASTPRSALEREVCRCFGEALGTDDVGIDDDFFLIGGHSLLVVPLCAALAAALGTEVNVVDVFEYPTARQLARALGRRGSGALTAAFAAP